MSRFDELGYGVKEMLGEALATPSKLVTPILASVSPDIAEIAIGVFCRFCSRFSAVTTTSWIPPDSAAKSGVSGASRTQPIAAASALRGGIWKDMLFLP